MSQNLPYWYSGVGFNAVQGLPAQAISKNKKNKQWKQSNLDALERIGLTQLKENIKFKDFYRMMEGKMAYSELSEVIPHLREIENMFDDLDIPTNLKHYDLLGIIVRALVGEYIQTADKFNVKNTDEIAQNEFDREKSDLLMKYVQEEFEKELQLRMIKMGINPDFNSMQFNSEEERQAYIQQIEQKRQELTPSEIENHMNTNWKTKAVSWGEHTLEHDRERFYMNELDRNELIDFFLTGRCFRHFRVGYDYYKPESWSSLNTFFSEDLETKYVQNGDYVGRVHFFTPSQFINKYGHKLTGKQKEKLLQNNYYNDGFSNNFSNISHKKMFESHFGETHIVPHENYYDHNFLTGIQNEFGVPLGEKTIVNKDGTETTTPSFIPSYNKFGAFGSHIARSLRDDLNLRGDLLQVTEAYWKSYKKVGYLTYMTEEGILTQDVVTEDILSDFLKESEIKSLKTKTLVEIEDNPEENTIVWDYVPEVWGGVKVSSGTNYLAEAMYLDIRPLEYQIKGEGNIYDVKLPVSGIVDTSLALKIQPYQVGHNIAMNQMYNLLEKEIGLFFIFDINFLPSEFKEWGNTEETLIHLRNITKDLSLFPVDTTRQNIKNGGGFNQFAPQNLSLSGQIADRMNVAEFYKNKAFEQVGFNPARLGNPVKYETAEGIRQSQTASFAQTEIYFEKFSDYKLRTLEMHLNVAQYCQKNDKDITVFYSKSDSTQAYLKFTDPYFHLRRLSILPVTNSKMRAELNNFKNFLMNNNTIGADEMSLAKIFTSDSMVELIEAARLERLRREDETQAQREHENRITESTNKAIEQREVNKWQREEYSKQKDRENKIEVERIDAFGRAADNDANIQSLQFIDREADRALKRQDSERKFNLDVAEHKRKLKQDASQKAIQMKELENRVEELRLRSQENRDKKYIAEINKN